MPAIGIALALVTIARPGDGLGLPAGAITDENNNAITDESNNAITDENG
jgi:hypothetical protein